MTGANWVSIFARAIFPLGVRMGGVASSTKRPTVMCRRSNSPRSAQLRDRCSKKIADSVLQIGKLQRFHSRHAVALAHEDQRAQPWLSLQRGRIRCHDAGPARGHGARRCGARELDADDVLRKSHRSRPRNRRVSSGSNSTKSPVSNPPRCIGQADVARTAEWGRHLEAPDPGRQGLVTAQA